MYKKIGQIFLFLLLSILVVEIVLLAPEEIGQNNSENEALMEDSLAYQDENIQQLMEGVHVVETKNDEKEWELWAEKATGFRKRGDLSLDIVRTLFFGSGESTFTVTGKKGFVNTDSKNMEVQGDVVTESSNGYFFKAETVFYDSENRKLSSPEDVEVIGPKDSSGKRINIKGKKMEANLENSAISIGKNVRALKPVQDSKLMRIRSERAYMSGSERSIRFSGNVIIDIEGVRATGPDALFKYDEKSDIIKEVLLSGGIRVSDDEKWATSQTVSIYLQEDRFVFNGNPRIMQDNDELRGDQIVFLNGGEQVQVKNARVKVKKEQLERLN